MNNNRAYVRHHNQVPAEIGRRVIDNGMPSAQLADRDNYIGVVLNA